MIKKIKKLATVTIASLMLLIPTAAPVFVASVSADSITSNLCTGAEAAAQSGTSGCGTAGSGNGTDDLKGWAARIVNIFSVVVGVVAIIMIIYGGFRYITSGGDSSNVGTAKNTIIYAIVGLIIVALAQVIVHYVLNTATNSSTSLGT